MACTYTIHGIGESCLGNKGGIKTVLLAPYKEGIFTVSGDTVTAIDTATKFYKFAFAKNLASMTSTLNADYNNAITYVGTDLVMQFNRMDTEKRIAVNALTIAETVALVEDNNGTWFALGLNEGCRPNAGSAQTGAAKTDGNFYSITIHNEDGDYPIVVDKAAAESVTVE